MSSGKTKLSLRFPLDVLATPPTSAHFEQKIGTETGIVAPVLRVPFRATRDCISGWNKNHLKPRSTEETLTAHEDWKRLAVGASDQHTLVERSIVLAKSSCLSTELKVGGLDRHKDLYPIPPVIDAQHDSPARLGKPT